MLRSRIGEKIQRLRFLMKYRKRHCIEVKSWEDSIEILNKEQASLCRFGDGEMLIVFQYLGLGISSSTFQNFDSALGERLLSILKGSSPSDNCYVALPHCMFGRGVSDMNFGARYFWERFSVRWIDTISGILPSQKIHGNIYLDTNMTRFYNDYKSKSGSRQQIDKIKTLWNSRDVLIVEGSQTRFGVGNDILDNAASVRRILVPRTDAFASYQSIFDSVIANSNYSNIVLIAAGMTATVLAYDLAKKGIQSIDIGHLDIEYEWLRLGASERVKIPGKFTNEAKDRSDTNEFIDSVYESQIIDRIDI